MSKLFEPVQDGDETFFPLGYISRGGLEAAGYDVSDLGDQELANLVQEYGNALQGSSSQGDVFGSYFDKYYEGEEDEDEDGNAPRGDGGDGE